MSILDGRDPWDPVAEYDQMCRVNEIARLEGELARRREAMEEAAQAPAPVSLGPQIMRAAEQTYEIDRQLGELNDSVLELSKTIDRRLDHLYALEKAVMAINRGHRELDAAMDEIEAAMKASR